MSATKITIGIPYKRKDGRLPNATFTPFGLEKVRVERDRGGHEVITVVNFREDELSGGGEAGWPVDVFVERMEPV